MAHPYLKDNEKQTVSKVIPLTYKFKISLFMKIQCAQDWRLKITTTNIHKRATFY